LGLDERSRLAPRRKILLTATLVLSLGSLATTLGYGLHLRSDAYRDGVADKLANRLRLNVSLASVEPLTFHARRLHDITLRSTRRDEDVFHCDVAEWRNLTRNGTRDFTIQISDGWLLVGSHGWGSSDYRELLASGLGHDFAKLGIREVRLQRIDLRWRYPGLEFQAQQAHGALTFDTDGVGRASLEAPTLNGFPVDEPIRIAARFRPGENLMFHEVILTAPEAPLRALGLEAFLGGDISQGRFAGDVRFRQRDGQSIVTVSGAVNDALLEELTRPLETGPVSGKVDVVVNQAAFENRQLTSLKFSGALSNVAVDPIGAILRAPTLGGVVDLRIHWAAFERGPGFERGRLAHLSAEGAARDVELSALTTLLGGGKITGRLRAEIHALQVVDDHLTHAHVTLEAVPPNGKSGTIDRELLSRISRETLGFDATTIVPSVIHELEYTRLGVDLELNGQTLRVRGTHGLYSDTILTLRIFGREIGVVKAPDRTFTVDDPMALLRRTVEEVDPDDIRHWWRTRQEQPNP
jgi:hypothetical protein